MLQQDEMSTSQETSTHHFVHEATALNLEDETSFSRQNVNSGDSLHGIRVMISHIGKMAEVMLPYELLCRLPAHRSD